MNFLRSVVIVMLGLIVVSVLPGSYITQSNGGGGGGSGNYSQSFTSQTSVALTHNLNTLNIIVQCFNAASPAMEVEWNTLTVTSVNTATVTFTDSQSGYCVVNGGSGSGGASFYQTIKVAGTSQPQEPALNFAANVTCTDTPGVSTNCTPSGGGGGGGSVPTAGWTLVNATNAHATFNNFSSTVASLGAEPIVTSDFAMAYQATPGATYTVIGTIQGFFGLVNGPEIIGFGITDGTKFEEIELLLEQSADAGQIQLRVLTETNFHSGTGTVVAGPTTTLVSTTPTFKIVNDGTHRTWYYFSNGSFVQFYQETSGTFLTETGVGITILNSNSVGDGVLTNSLITWSSTSP